MDEHERREGDSQQRIEQLEQEVARLRSALEQQEQAPGEVAPGPTAEPDGGSPEEEQETVLPSKRRAVILAVLIAAVALAGILAITYSLSSVIQPFSRKAARFISPWEPAQEQSPAPGAKTAPAPPASGEEHPRAPGL